MVLLLVSLSNDKISGSQTCANHETNQTRGKSTIAFESIEPVFISYQNKETRHQLEEEHIKKTTNIIAQVNISYGLAGNGRHVQT